MDTNILFGRNCNGTCIYNIHLQHTLTPIYIDVTPRHALTTLQDTHPCASRLGHDAEDSSPATDSDGTWKPEAVIDAFTKSRLHQSTAQDALGRRGLLRPALA